MRTQSLKLSLAAAAVAATALVPAVASAQTYGQPYYNPSYGGATRYDSYGRPYDYCTQERQGRTGAGAVIGGGAGAVIGSQLAARGRRTEGSILGGVLGAVIGGSVGRSSSNACEAYHGSAYDQRSDYAYGGYSQG